MSFNPNDNNLNSISRNNYEEHFLLYADNELSADEKAVVEEFVNAHPDLQQELDLFLMTKLPIEIITLEGKETLLADSMKLNSIDEELLLYIDNELADEQKIEIEQRLKKDKAFQLQYADLLKTKPGSPEKIVYPYKKELYRYEEKKPFPVYWMRIAAAVVIILSMGIFVFTYESKPGVVIADGTKTMQPVKEIEKADLVKADLAIKTESTKPVKPDVAKTANTDNAPNLVKNLEKKKLQLIKKQPVVLSPEENQSPVIAKKQQKRPDENNIVVNRKTEDAPQQTINIPSVTPPSVASLNNQTTSPVTAVQLDVVKIDNEKKSSLKGILRKATRFIERRTNISTTNEDNELLIGAVAVKL